ncbi:hypothetical protein [Streptomyces sp. NPDC003247]|uniref:hypothetical protein n=1 Tax=Streptomyces sp. NPDC003247 TaxID=3364677 RepID=UPI003690A405
MGGQDDPSLGEALISLVLIAGAGVLVPATVVLPLIGLGIWIAHLVRRRRR